ncbi:MarR family transcriptional regulator [Nitrogeniibacter mangrovi]|uniref:MarR family transcriptional regulator n=1 Tax=Nitrogeniibacter mangrovi TaxID=2016596 RepID=A0A6C1B855_9RHOO|nr:MarR family transcriptional regulator [Nitrogeniibacter mangrovi]QID19553.1 MarR family transcriptional regulator [Nitrogeniibacter mangrovi]
MLRQTAESFPEINTPGMRLIARIFRLRDLIFENAQREMARFDLSAAEYSVLATLRKTPAPHALRPSDIYKGMLLSSGGLTKVLKSLEQRELIERTDDPDDRRGSIVHLTDTGIAFAEDAMRAVIGSDIALLRRVADADTVDALSESLQPFTEALDR